MLFASRISLNFRYKIVRITSKCCHFNSSNLQILGSLITFRIEWYSNYLLLIQRLYIFWNVWIIFRVDHYILLLKSIDLTSLYILLLLLAFLHYLDFLLLLFLFLPHLYSERWKPLICHLFSPTIILGQSSNTTRNVIRTRSRLN